MTDIAYSESYDVQPLARLPWRSQASRSTDIPTHSRLRIGLNLLYLRPGVVGGTETYARGLLGGLAAVAQEHKFLVFLNKTARDWPLPDGFDRVICSVSGRPSSRYLYEQVVLPALLMRHKVQLVHSLAYVAPILPPCASVVTIHDLNFQAPSHRMPAIRRHALGWFVSAAAQSSNAIIVVSHFIRDELAQTMPDASEKLHVVYEAPVSSASDAERASPSRVARGPYLLAFSSVSPNKNLGRLFEAYASARGGGLRHDLVVVGHRPRWAREDVPGVLWAGYLSDTDVRRILGGADGLLFPSLYEGFGLPVLEAMQAGVAVACSRSASLPEIAGDAALYFDAEDVASIASAISRLAADSTLRTTLISRGTARAACFNWERAAQETLSVYQFALESR